ncbi:hypothetical protein AB852_28645 [Streptomyces uncialis]|uniref:Uncharacterized protein n=1 Tax=Streptomyces uncialis TaxID=1048205 RepID=A0A1Q4V136_9ACTN|nr:hypothetical protein AB852_28645 [Streptomyces uncialis]
MPGKQELAPECEHRIHDICHGTYAVYVEPFSVPAVAGRCDCPCHTTEAAAVPKAAATGGG